MNDQYFRLEETVRVLLAARALLVMSPCWGCRDKEPEPEPAEQVAESNAPDTVAEKTTMPGDQPSISLAKIPLRALYVGLPGTERQNCIHRFDGRRPSY